VIPHLDFKVTDALDVLCAQLTCDLFAIGKFLVVTLQRVTKLLSSSIFVPEISLAYICILNLQVMIPFILPKLLMHYL